MRLWRPTGLREMALVYESSLRAFPPRLPGQDIFYPVLDPGYADQIARDWNTKQDSFAGYVLRFEVPDEFALQFGPHVVGAPEHQELWVPASQLSDFNRRIVGAIEVERAFFGKDFKGHVPTKFGLQGVNALEQPKRMLATLDYSRFDFHMEISANAMTFFLNFPFWMASPASHLGLTDAEHQRFLQAIEQDWGLYPKLAPLPKVGAAA